MATNRFMRPFRQLRGKLTLSYTLTAVVSFLLVEVIAIVAIFLFVSLNISTLVLNNFKQDAPQASPYFVQSVPNRELLTTWLHGINVSLSNQGFTSNNSPIFLAVVDTRGQTVASIGSHPVPVDALIQPQLSPHAAANLRAVLGDVKGTTSTVDQEADGTLLTIAPIVVSGEQVQGALIMRIAQPDKLVLFFDFIRLILLTVTIVTIIAAIAGLVFGYLTARGITRRLQGLSVAADAWGHGDFSAHANDASEDELGQVARQLNRMAEQLQNLLQARQKLATLEERNRLARDLHDSVKQQIFAVSMQIGATRLLLKRDVNAAEARLNEAEKLVHQAQQELTSLIRELRPVALEGKGLIAALRELATDWTQQTNIVATLRVEGITGTLGTEALPLTLEEALFRVAQEALSNVVRHSKATLVQLTLTLTSETVTLSVTDNGQGLDTTRHSHLGVGLLSMQERMKVLGGDMQVESTTGKGTRIIAHCQRSGVGASDTTPTLEKGHVENLISVESERYEGDRHRE
jgi:two-component system, NarL family, sensor histidine kinase LiaS